MTIMKIMGGLRIPKSVKTIHEHTLYWTSIGWDVLRGDHSPGIYVLGYVKSGTNWLCHLLSGILEMPILEAWKVRLPVLHPCVYHTHRFIPLDSIRRRTIYIMRDGRDTLVSYYFHLIREQGPQLRQAEQVIGRRLTAENIRENLPGFISYLQATRTSTADWRTHIETWQRFREQYFTIRYEDLLTDAESELIRAIQALTGRQPEAGQVRSVVQQQDFRTVTQRAPGHEDSNKFMRKGVQGDWRNNFSRSAARKFNAYAGQLLIDLGYESDPSWTEKVAD